MDAQASLFPPARRCDCCGHVAEGLVEEDGVAVCRGCRVEHGERFARAMARRLPRSRAVEIVFPFTVDESMAALRRSRKGRRHAPLDHLIMSMVQPEDRQGRPAERVELHRRSSTIVDPSIVEAGGRSFVLPSLVATGVIFAANVPIAVTQTRGRGQLRAVVWWA